MKNHRLLTDYLAVAEIHATRLNEALNQTQNMSASLTADLLPQLSSLQVAFLDMLSMRFSKLQDLIGAKIFPLILDVLVEDAPAFIDKINKLERLAYLDPYNANWWMSLREIRNQLNHDYPDDYELIAAHLSILITKTSELILFWNSLKSKIKSQILAS